jgi:hypothetical protein
MNCPTLRIFLIIAMLYTMGRGGAGVNQCSLEWTKLELKFTIISAIRHDSCSSFLISIVNLNFMLPLFEFVFSYFLEFSYISANSGEAIIV